MLFERFLIYKAKRYPNGPWEEHERELPENTPAPLLEDVHLAAADGTKIHGWLAKPDNIATTGRAVLWLHGNAMNVAYRYSILAMLTDVLKSDIFVIDYRGYGKSKGVQSEPGLYMDARAAWDYLIEQGYKSDQIVLLGNSIGVTVATQLATQVRPAGLIMQAGFSSIPDMAKYRYPFFPLSWIKKCVKHEMNTVELAKQATCPKLLIHGDADDVCPYWMGERIYATMPEPKEFLTLPEIHHTNIYTSGTTYLQAIEEFVHRVTIG